MSLYHLEDIARENLEKYRQDIKDFPDKKYEKTLNLEGKIEVLYQIAGMVISDTESEKVGEVWNTYAKICDEYFREINPNLEFIGDPKYRPILFKIDELKREALRLAKSPSRLSHPHD